MVCNVDYFLVVGAEHKCRPKLTVYFFHESQNSLARDGVEIRSGFVGKHYQRFSRNRDALSLSARELVRPMFRPLGKSHLFDQKVNPFFPFLRFNLRVADQ